MHRYLTILEDSLAKKDQLLAKLLEICAEQEDAICGEKIDSARYNRVTDTKEPVIKQIELLDDGFCALNDRVMPTLSVDPGKYADHIRRMQELIASVSEKTVLLEAADRRIDARLERLSAHGRPDDRTSHTPPGTASQKYQNTMNGSAESNSVFVDSKRKK